MIFHKAIENIFKAQLYVRCDDTGLVHYFSCGDFPGLNGEAYEFNSSLGHSMKGYFYSYGDADRGRLIVFEHGFGGGHRSYMKEIERLCREGYLVFAYDHTGCMESGGDNTGGFSQSLRDLDDCLKALKSDEKVNTKDISVMGHSWGGFSTLNITDLHPDVKRIVVLSGFISPEKIIEQNLPGVLAGYRKHIIELEKKSNPEYFAYNGVDTLEKNDVRALLIYSDNDSLVAKSLHYDALHNALKDKPNVKLMLVSGKGHNPNYTSDAVGYLGELALRTKKEGKKLKSEEEKKAFRDSFDWERMTKQDDAVWAEIFAFLKA